MILDRILETKREEVAAAKARLSEAELRRAPGFAEPRRGFHAALRREGRAVIAEIKKASPSRGVIREDFDPVLHARQYQDGGARCISVLTDEQYFQGSLDYLRAVRGATTLPTIRKDFVIDPYQLVEARCWGADAVLLIVAALEPERLAALSEAAAAEGLDVLTEVHTEAELEVALSVGATLIGVNNRDLNTFEVSLDTSRRLAALVPDGVTLVSESGLRRPEELTELESVGVRAFLIGERLMAEPDPGVALAALVQG